MTKTQRILAPLLLIASIAVSQEANFRKAVREAIDAGDLPKAKQLCDGWAEKKPDDEQPYLSLGRIYLRLDLADRALEQFEMAREINPLNPEPSCELARIFLKARKTQQAIAEFQAALKVLKDYEPALKGLTQAQELLANPYRDGVYIKLGESNKEYGLKQLHQERSRVFTIGGRQCRGMNVDGHVSFLYFDVDDEYLSDVDLPVRVTVEYYDEGSHYFRLKYDSTDSGAHWHGAHKRAERVKRTDSKTWRKHTFSLPDARFANRASGADVILWRDRENLRVSSVRVVRGGLAASVEPKVAVCHGICVVTAKVVGAQGPAPDGATVRFVTDRGTIATEAETVGGQAQADFEAGDEAGEATVTVQAGEDQCTVHVPILQGRGEIVRQRLLLDRLERGTDWQTGGTKGTQAVLDTGPALDRDGRPSTKLVYKLAKGESNSYVSLARTILLPGRPTSLGLWVHQDNTRGVLHADLVDATGQTHSFALGEMKSPKWHWMEQAIGQATHHHGGANDGRLHLPVRLSRLFLRRGYGPSARDVEGGEISLRDLTLVTEIPESETVLLDVVPDGPSSAFDLTTGAAFRSDVVNMRADLLRAPLRWSIANDENRVVAEGCIEDLDVEAGTRRSERIAQPIDLPGVYRATFTLQADDSDADAQQRRRLSKDLGFLLLRDISQIGLSASASPAAKGPVVQIANRGDQTREFALTYRVLNGKNDVLRAGALGGQNITVDPAEEIECSLALDGLPPGRYSLLLLFDTRSDGRFTSVLGHEVLPTAVIIEGRVLGGDEPIAGASVRGRLARRRYRYSTLPEESIDTWSAATDGEGKFTLDAVRVPPDADRCRLYVDVVAKGFVDVQRTYSLRRRIPSGGRQPDPVTLRLKRGLSLTGRVVGAGGKPVSGARLHVASTVTKEGRRTRVCCYRPRETSVDGCFELPVLPTAQTELVVHTSQWAPKRTLVAPDRLSAGDIQLERGTAVSGRLLHEDGDPAAGYWVVAENYGRTGPRMIIRPLRVAAKTATDGSFALPPLKGKFTIWAPAAFEWWHSEGYVRSPKPRLALLPQDRVFAGAGDRVELELRASPGVRVAGRVTESDGKPAKRALVYLQCGAMPIVMPLTFDATETDEFGCFAFEAIPRGLKNVVITAPVLLPWKKGKKTFLRARPLPHVEGARKDGTVGLDQIDEDLLNVDFEYQPWSSKDGFLAQPPAPAPAE